MRGRVGERGRDREGVRERDRQTKQKLCNIVGAHLF